MNKSDTRCINNESDDSDYHEMNKKSVKSCHNKDSSSNDGKRNGLSESKSCVRPRRAIKSKLSLVDVDVDESTDDENDHMVHNDENYGDSSGEEHDNNN